MSLKQLLGELATSIAAGFLEQLGETLKAESRQLGSHSQARQIGQQIADELFHTEESAITLTPKQGTAFSESELIEGRMAVWNHPTEQTPEIKQALAHLQVKNHHQRSE